MTVGRDDFIELIGSRDPYLAGSSYFTQGQYSKAAEFFSKDLEANTSGIQAYLSLVGLGRTKLALNNVEEAHELFDLAIRIGSTMSDKLTGTAYFFRGLCNHILGNVNYNKQNYVIAVGDYTRALERKGHDESENFFIYFNRALLYLENKNYDLAYKDLSEASASMNVDLEISKYLPAADYFKHICLIHMGQEAVAMNYFAEQFCEPEIGVGINPISKDVQLLLQQTTPNHIYKYSISLKQVITECLSHQVIIAEKFLHRGNFHFLQNKISLAMKDFATAVALGVEIAKGSKLYMQGLLAVKQGDNEEAISHFNNALSATVTPSQRLHILTQLNKLGVNINIKNDVESIKQTRPKIATNTILLLIAISLPTYFNDEVFTDFLKDLFKFNLENTLKFLREELIITLTQTTLKLEKFPVTIFENVASTKEALLEFMTEIKNPILRQTALVQALLPGTILGKIYNVAQGSFAPTLATSKNKQNIAAALLKDLQQLGPLMSDESRKALNENGALKKEIKSNCPELYKELVAAKIFVEGKFYSGTISPSLTFKQREDGVYEANYTATTSGYKLNPQVKDETKTEMTLAKRK